MPALIVLCVVLMVLGWWALLPIDYAALGIHAVYSLVFLSNIRFWGEAGYFDAASHEKWLLHTWSLAVEWQFYLLLPLLLMAGLEQRGPAGNCGGRGGARAGNPGGRGRCGALNVGGIEKHQSAPAFKEAQATKGYACRHFMDWAMGQLAAVPGNVPVVVVHRLSFYAFGENDSSTEAVPLVFFSRLHPSVTSEFLREFAGKVTGMACQMARHRTVYLVRPIPEMKVDVPKSMARSLLPGQDKDISIALAAYHQRHALVWAAQDAARERCGVKILDPLPYLCPDGRCQGARNGRPLYHDDDHLSDYGNKLLVTMFAEVFQAPGNGAPDLDNSRAKNQLGFFR